jgi:hypothetical protein
MDGQMQTYWERRGTRTRTGEDRTATGSKPNDAPAITEAIAFREGAP